MCRPFPAFPVQAPPQISSKFLHYHRVSPILPLVLPLHRSQTPSSRPPLSERLASLHLPLNNEDLYSPLPPLRRPPVFVPTFLALLPLPRPHTGRLRRLSCPGNQHPHPVHAHQPLPDHLRPHLSRSHYHTILAGGPQLALSWNPLHKTRYISTTLDLGLARGASPNANAALHSSLQAVSLPKNGPATLALSWIIITRDQR